MAAPHRRRRPGATALAVAAAAASSGAGLASIFLLVPCREVLRAALAASLASRWRGSRPAAAAGGREAAPGPAAAKRTAATRATTAAAGTAAAVAEAAAVAPGSMAAASRRRGPVAGTLAGSSSHSGGAAAGLERMGGKRVVSVVWCVVQVVRSRPVSQYIGHGASVPRSRHYGPIGGASWGVCSFHATTASRHGCQT